MVCLFVVVDCCCFHYYPPPHPQSFSCSSCCFNVVVSFVVPVALFQLFDITHSDVSDLEMKIPCFENLKFPSFKAAVGQNVAVHAMPAARNSACLIFCILGFVQLFCQSFSDIK